MRIRICQTNPLFLDVKSNLEEVIGKIRKGSEEGAELIVFPELALTGYFVGEHYHEVSLRMDSREIRMLAEATKGTAAVVGFIEESPAMNFYNSALVAVDGKIQFAYRKLNLPNYGLFEERKFFAPGKVLPVFKLKDFILAVFICNDLWHPSLPYLGVTQKAEIFVNIFNSCKASMGDEFNNIETWGIINTFYSRIFGIYNICANRVGEEGMDGNSDAGSPGAKNESDASSHGGGPSGNRVCHFWGGSEIINPFGQTVVKAPLDETAEIDASIDRDLLRRKKVLLPYLRNDDPYFTHRELNRILYRK